MKKNISKALEALPLVRLFNCPPIVYDVPMDLFQRPAYWLALPLLVGGLMTLPALTWAEQDISLDDSSTPATTAGSTGSPQATPVSAIPTATFIPVAPTSTPVPAVPQATVTPIPPTPTFTSVPAQPTPTSTPAPKVKPAKQKAAEAPDEDQEAAPQTEAAVDNSLDTPDPFKALADDMKRNSKFELTFDGQYSRAYQDLTSNGYGLLIRAEYKFPHWVSLGIDYDFVYYTNGFWNAVGSFDMLLRLIPVQVGGDEYYLIGGAGLNSLPQANPNLYPGPFHLYGGIGARLSMDQDWGIDLNVVYDRYSPDVDPLGTVTARLGFSYSGGM